MAETKAASATATENILKRSALVHYLDSTFGGATASWFLIGKHVQDMSVELNPEVEQFKNILDDTVAVDNGYSPSMSVDTYYADPKDGEFYEKIKDISMNRLTGDSCKTRLLEVLIDKKGSSTYDAWCEDVIIKPQSYGGAPGGVRIPYQVTFCGNRIKGTASLESINDKTKVSFIGMTI